MKETDCKGMNIVIGDKWKISTIVAEHISAQARKNGLRLCAAGGTSTAGVYSALCSMGVSGITVFAADEYFGTDDQRKNIEKQLPGAMVYAPKAVFESAIELGVLDHDYLEQSDIGDGLSRELEFCLKVTEPGIFEKRRSAIIEHYERIKTGLDSAHAGDMECLCRNQLVRLEEQANEAARMLRTMHGFCKEYDRLLDDGGIDIMLLGMGEDGHMASIMPGKLDDSEKTHLVRYPTPHNVSTGKTNYGITVGIRTILEAKEVIVLAFSEQKADAVERSLYEPVYGTCPASYLRKSGNVWFCMDYGAVSKIPK